MIKQIFILIIITFLFLINLTAQEQNAFPILRGPFLGQKPPGMVPKIFAPGVVSTSKSEFNAAFSPDNKEFFFSITESSGRETIMVMKYEDKKWSEPVNPGPPVNSGYDEYYVSITKEGTIYFASNRPGGLGSFDIYRSRRVNNKYMKPENLGESVNSKYLEHDPFIALDESYLIFTSVNRPAGFGTGDMYISFSRKDGTWSKAKNMGKVFNTNGYDFCPMVSADRKYFFFTRKGDIYWVDAKIIEDLKPKK